MIIPPDGGIFLYACLVVNVSLSGLTYEHSCWNGILSAIFDEMGATLPEIETDILSYALFPEIQYPIIIKGSGIDIGFTTNNNQFDAIKIFLNIDSFKQGLGGDAFMLDGKFFED